MTSQQTVLATGTMPPAQLSAPDFTVATLINNPAQYQAMRASFEAHGFTPQSVEFLAAHNPKSAYSALNDLLNEARGRYVILCHQDIRLIGDDRAALEARLRDLDQRDPSWALAGNSGAVAVGRMTIRITDPHGRDQRHGTLPARVMSLDENFIVVRRAARIGFSRNLDGFHLYGADICLAADMMGHSAYVIDFHLEHLSGGRKDASFTTAVTQFRAKWSKALRPRWLQTPCTLMSLSGGLAGRLLGRLGEKPYWRLARHLPGATGWHRNQAPTAGRH